MSMRLTPFEVDAIKKSVHDVFGPEAEVILFGSRVDDSMKGGDIDLYVKAPSGNDLAHKIRFQLMVEQKIGEQRIDVVLAHDENRPIERKAIEAGILL